MYYIKSDTGERFSVHTGFSVLGSYTRFASPAEAFEAFKRSSYRGASPDPWYYLIDERNGMKVSYWKDKP